MDNHLKTASHLANFLDNQFNFGGLRFGFSALIDLIPGVGDMIDALLSLYIVWIAVQMSVPSYIIARMIGNIAINFIIGLLPVFGDVIYFIRKVNVKNVKLLRDYVTPEIIQT